MPQMNIRVTNVSKPAVKSVDPAVLALDRARKANARLQSEVAAANRKVTDAVASQRQSAHDLEVVNAELAKARKTIADLNQKLRQLTTKLAATSRKKHDQNAPEKIATPAVLPEVGQ